MKNNIFELSLVVSRRTCLIKGRKHFVDFFKQRPNLHAHATMFN